jgi:transmembrane sensor
VEIKNLIEKYLQNECTLEEAKFVLEWISTSEGQQYIAERLNIDINEDKNFTTDHPVRSVYIYQQINKEIESNRQRNSIFRIFQQPQKWQKIAAAILFPLLVINMVFWYMFINTNEKIVWQEVSVHKGQKLQVLFQDGTRVWLNSGSRLQYPTGFRGKERQVKLEGEAYFVVKKNPKKPFFVHVKNIDVRVTGTSFNVRAYNDEKSVTTTLDEGKISLLLNQKAKRVEYLLKPGQQASFSKNNLQISIAPSKKENSSWKDNRLDFNDTPLQDVVHILERWYNVKFEIADSNLVAYKYTISFQNEPLQNVLSGLEKITPIQCKLTSKGIIEIKRRRTK